jgi:acetyl-CoA synthetase
MTTDGPTELKTYLPSAASVAGAHVQGMAAYEALCQEAEADYAGFWARHARELLSWKTPFTQVLDDSNAPFFKWFADGTLNASVNCLDRNIERGLGDKTAIIFEADGGEVTRATYSQLLAKTCQIANGLRSLGVQKGDRVIIYISMSIDGVAAMQACARIGATHSVVFGGFSAQSLRDRIEDTGAVAVITADHQVRGGKQLPLKSIVDEALAMPGCGSVKNVLVVKRSGGSINMVAGRDQWMADVADGQPTTCEPEWVGAEHPLFLLYTSGSTGKPKGVQHSTGGYLLHAALTTKLHLRPEGRRRVLVHRRHRLGDRPHLHHLWPAGPGRHRDRVRRRAHLPRRRPLLEDDPGPQGHRIFYTAPTAIRSLIKAAEANDECTPRATTSPACASWARSASRSTRPPGSGTTSMSAAAAAPSSTPGGRPRPAAT